MHSHSVPQQRMWSGSSDIGNSEGYRKRLYYSHLKQGIIILTEFESMFGELASEMSRSLWRGRIYVREFPTRIFSFEGDDIVSEDRHSRFLELDGHFKNWYPPPSLSLGYAFIMTSLNSSGDASRLLNSISFSPRPALKRASL